MKDSHITAPLQTLPSLQSVNYPFRPVFASWRAEAVHRLASLGYRTLAFPAPSPTYLLPLYIPSRFALQKKKKKKCTMLKHIKSACRDLDPAQTRRMVCGRVF